MPTKEAALSCDEAVVEFIRREMASSSDKDLVSTWQLFDALKHRHTNDAMLLKMYTFAELYLTRWRGKPIVVKVCMAIRYSWHS